MENIDIYKVLAFCGYESEKITKELLEEELKKIEKQEWDVYHIYNYIGTLGHVYPILEKIPLGIQFDIIAYYNSGWRSHQGFCKKRKWVKRVDYNEMVKVMEFMHEKEDRLYNFLSIYVWIYLLG